MKRFDKFKIWFGKKVDSVIEISETDKLQAKIKDKEEKYNQVKESYYEAEGKKKTIENKINGMKKTLEDIKVAARKCKENNDDINLKKLFVSQKNVEKEISMYEETLSMNTKMASELYNRKTEMETYINELKHKIEQLKIKEDYTKQANNFLTVVENIKEDDSFENSEDVINVEFNAAEFKIEDYKEDLSPEDIINKYSEQDEFEKFKSEL